MFAANLWNIAEVKVFGIKRAKADQSFRADEMKVQTRSPCERTVDGEKKNRSDTPIVVPVKIVIFIAKKGYVSREKKKKYIRRLSKSEWRKFEIF